MSTGGFFERWSRRKLHGGETEEPVDPVDDRQVASAEVPDEETLDEAELARLPALESFTPETDLAPFLRKGVPHALRNAAMRKMWMLDPAIRDHKDLAVDYAWDWNTPGGVPGNSGTISPDSVARMLESLNPKREGAVAAQADSPDSVPDTGGTTASVSPEAQALRPEDPPTRGDSADADAMQPTDRTAQAAAPRRRHGGAAPV